MKTLARDADQSEILHRLHALRHDSARQWGRMSAHQMVCHLSDGYRMLLGQRPTPLVASPLPRPIVKLIALYVPLRWPTGLSTTPELDQGAGGGTTPVNFDEDVAELSRLLGTIVRLPRDQFARQQHPFFGRMSESSWLRWAYLHADHHLRQFAL